MKNDITNMPSIVAYVKASAFYGTPIGYATYERAIKEHPEYFPEEVEYRRKFNAIPAIEKEWHFNKLIDLHNQQDLELSKNGYVSGIIAAIKGDNNDKSDLFDTIKAKYEKLREEENQRFVKRWNL